MLNFLHDPIPITLSNVFTLVTDKNRRYHVTDNEQSLVLKAYEELNGDWEKMVEYMKDNVMRSTWRLYEKVQNERVLPRSVGKGSQETTSQDCNGKC